MFSSLEWLLASVDPIALPGRVSAGIMVCISLNRVSLTVEFPPNVPMVRCFSSANFANKHSSGSLHMMAQFMG